MPKRDEREKASDVFRSSRPFPGETLRFDQVFPDIEDLRVEVRLSKMGISNQEDEWTFTRAHLPGEYFDCTNSVCYAGGFSLGQILREMSRSRQTELETHKRCQGYEGSPKGRRKYRNCVNSFDINVTIRYKDEADAATKGGS